MGIKFVHTSDWQIGRAFRNFDDRIASVLEAARLEAIDSIAAVASSGGAQHVLVAGDIYDSPDLAARTLRQVLERMKQRTDVTWWLLPGNHDPARTGGVWDRVQGLGVPANVMTLTEPGVREMASGVYLLPAPLVSRSVARDPTAWMEDCATPDGAIRIGIAHGSITRFGSEEDDGVIDPGRVQSARLDYLALGDWHGTTQVNARTWYSGTPEPDRFRDNAPGHVLLVSIEGAGAVPVVEMQRTARYTWVAERAEIGDVALLGPIEQGLIARGTLADLLVQVTLTGRMPASAQGALADWRDSLDARVRYLEVDTSSLSLTMGEDDYASLGDDAALREVAARLARIADDEASPKREAAKLAIAKLFELTRRARQASSREAAE